MFSTAFDAFAVRAFEVAAVDYLLKPFTQARFDEALGRALGPSGRGSRPAGRRGEAERVVEVVRRATYPARLLVEGRRRLRPGRGPRRPLGRGRRRLHAAPHAGPDVPRVSGIGALSERLDPARFARVHRSTVVALDALRALERDNSGGFVARLEGGAVVRVSRTYADTIRDMMA